MHDTKGSRQLLEKRRKRGQRILIIAAVLVLIGILMLLPPIRTRIGYRLDDLRTRITYALNPPDEAVFVPEEQNSVETIVAETMQAMTPTFTATSVAILGPETTPEPSLTPTITPTPLPTIVDLRDQVTYVDQHERWNYCGPANLTMALNFWGWTGTRDDVAKAIKPGESDPEKNFIDRGKSDKNVMPYEMVDFVNDKTDLAMLSRLRRRDRGDQTLPGPRLPGADRKRLLRAGLHRQNRLDGALSVRHRLR